MRVKYFQANRILGKQPTQDDRPAQFARSFEVISYNDHVSVARAITDMVVRGAPAIGAAAAFGLALAGFESASSSSRELIADCRLRVRSGILLPGEFQEGEGFLQGRRMLKVTVPLRDPMEGSHVVKIH